MSESNKTYRIKADVLGEQSISLNLAQDYESFDILSVNISQADLYKLHSADYGVVVGRVVANGNFGIPNAKVSIFIPRDNNFNVTSEIESITLIRFLMVKTRRMLGIIFYLTRRLPIATRLLEHSRIRLIFLPTMFLWTYLTSIINLLAEQIIPVIILFAVFRLVIIHFTWTLTFQIAVFYHRDQGILCTRDIP